MSFSLELQIEHVKQFTRDILLRKNDFKVLCSCNEKDIYTNRLLVEIVTNMLVVLIIQGKLCIQC